MFLRTVQKNVELKAVGCSTFFQEKSSTELNLKDRHLFSVCIQVSHFPFSLQNQGFDLKK